jgi:serine/threonine-protein kinase
MADAEKTLRSALIVRETFRVLNNMGSLLLSERKFAEALPYLQKAAALTPNDYVVLLNLADVQRDLGHAIEARTNYQKGMDLALTELSQSPGSGLARGFVAYFAARLGDRKRAQQEIRQALRTSPGDNTIIRRAALTYETLGMRAEALEALSGATGDLLRDLERDPDLADFCQDLRFRQLVAANFKK